MVPAEGPGAPARVPAASGHGLTAPRRWLFVACLTALTAAVFLPVSRAGFIALDDGAYVSENRQVVRGLTLQGFKWAFTSVGVNSNWHPLTWLSHQADVQLFGLDAGKHHLVNLALHLSSTILLFLVLVALTGASWPSAATAALFAVHPLHVESVAWIAERKDVLSGAGFMLALLWYVGYARKPGAARLAAVSALFALTLMAKPMAVTLPFVLMLLDWWPLGRLGFGQGGGQAGAWAARARVLGEKAPLFLMTAASSVITYAAQRRGGGANALRGLPLAARAGNAVWSYLVYLGKTVWPADLGVLYPHPGPGLPWWKPAAALLLLAAVTAGVLRAGRRFPYLPVGWFWYLGMLVPVIGLVQVGVQGHADRYTYLPLVGIFLAVAWGSGAAGSPAARRFAGVALAAVILVLALAARRQVGYWMDSVRLFRHTLEVTDRNWLIRNNLGKVLFDREQLDEAEANLAEAIRLKPDYPAAHYNLGNVLFARGRLDEAARSYQEAVRLNPAYSEAWNNWGNCYLRRGNYAEALAVYRQGVKRMPGYAEIYGNIGVALHRLGRIQAAAASFDKALRMDPDSPVAHYNLGVLLQAEGKFGEAEARYRTALQLRPDYELARRALEHIVERSPAGQYTPEAPSAPPRGIGPGGK